MKRATKDDVKATETEALNLAEVIHEISSAVERLLASGLNRDAVVILLSYSTGLGQRKICTVLDALEDLANKYTHEPERNCDL